MPWITVDDVKGSVGLEPADAVDDVWLADVTAAANDWAFERRRKNGYVDDVDTVPNASVKLGTVFVAEALYRMRGAVDGFASFADMTTSYVPVGGGTSAQINRLLGIPRPVAV